MSEKSARALRTIGEVATELGVEAHVLRFWESKFTDIKPQKRRGRRYYRPQDIKLVTIIKSLLYTQGFTIKGAQRFLKKNAERIDQSTIYELTESMLIGAADASSNDKAPAQPVKKEEPSTKANDEHKNTQPLLFPMSAKPQAGADISTTQHGQQAVAHAVDNVANISNSRLAESDIRRLKEIYRGLNYTKEKLDQLS